MSTWIRCTERMPREGRPVRIYMHNIGFKTAMYFPMAQVFFGCDNHSPYPAASVVSWREIDDNEERKYRIKVENLMF